MGYLQQKPQTSGFGTFCSGWAKQSRSWSFQLASTVGRFPVIWATKHLSKWTPENSTELCKQRHGCSVPDIAVSWSNKGKQPLAVFNYMSHTTPWEEPALWLCNPTITAAMVTRTPNKMAKPSSMQHRDCCPPLKNAKGRSTLGNKLHSLAEKGEEGKGHFPISSPPSILGAQRGAASRADRPVLGILPYWTNHQKGNSSSGEELYLTRNSWGKHPWVFSFTNSWISSTFFNNTPLEARSIFVNTICIDPEGEDKKKKVRLFCC